MPNISARIAQELGVQTRPVEAAVHLLDGGATVPFIARYRKEATGGLDDTQLRFLEDRLGYLRELEARRDVILRRLTDHGPLTAALEREILAADTKTRLEDLYLPYKPKRRTKAQIAREGGLEPLALGLLKDPSQSPEQSAVAFVEADKGVVDVKSALEGARQILMEQFAEDAELLGKLRDFLWEHGELRSRVVAGKEQDGAKFADYFDYRERLKTLPSHRVLALLRGHHQGMLTVTLTTGADTASTDPGETLVAERFGIRDQGRAADPWLRQTVRWAWKVKLFPPLDRELKAQLKERAEAEGIRVFAGNLKDLLLAAPAGRLPIIGLDPGLRTGVKGAVVDATGKLVATLVIYPHPPRNDWEGSIAALAMVARQHGVKLISIGNGTASRETDRLAGDLIRRHPELGLRKRVVSEAGASVYSASELAAQELPGIDVSLRGAVSIARRLQDPLAELVKIDPKSIGVGQYQHDVNPVRLTRMLDHVVEDCVNSVGVDVNTASVALLSRVAGLNRALAENLVAYRDIHGAFPTREALKQVPRLGAKTFEQAAGFLRIVAGGNPLDSSAVHPEAYPVVQRILQRFGKGLSEILGNTALLRTVSPEALTDPRFGLPTVRDILTELEKPGRDPRPTFQTARFEEGVEKLEDLTPGRVLEGVVSNVTPFGAFIDIGVHQEGLVHISAMADRFVKDPREVVRVGDVVKVKVVAVDLPRRRIALSMRLAERTQAAETAQPPRPPQQKAVGKRASKPERPAPAPADKALASALTQALKGKR